MGGSVESDDGCIVKVRGLPWSTTEEDVVKFFSECNIRGGKNGVQMTLSREGRPSGEAYIEMDTPEDVELACKRDRDYMGHRYIEVFKANRSEMEWVVERCGHNVEQSRVDATVRLRGLPFHCTADEIIHFFRGLEIVGNGIILAKDSSTGRPTGEAFVQFINKETAEKALLKHKDKIGHRYIEIFRSSIAEAKLAAGPKMRSGSFMSQRHMPYDRNDRFGGGGPNRYNSMLGSRNSRGLQSFRGMNDGGMDGGGGWGGGGAGGGSMWNSPGGGSGRPPLMDPRMRGFNSDYDLPMNQSVSIVHMRGLPFRATQADIADFFRPLIPLNIRILYDNSGRPSGEADVEFASLSDAEKAMKKDKSHMQHRYIELFLDHPGSNNSFIGGGLSRPGGGNFRRY